MAEQWRVPVVSVGEMLRKEIAAKSPVGTEAARYLDGGRLVPDALAVASVDGWLERQHGDSFVFDGFPRTVGQAEALQGLLARRGSPLTAVLWLDLDDARIAERVRQRLTCGKCGATFRQVQGQSGQCSWCAGPLEVRKDDEPGALATRLELYRAHTVPVADYYERLGLLHRIEAGLEVPAVFARIEAAVGITEPAEAAGV